MPTKNQLQEENKKLKEENDNMKNGYDCVSSQMDDEEEEMKKCMEEFPEVSDENCMGCRFARFRNFTDSMRIAQRDRIKELHEDCLVLNKIIEDERKEEHEWRKIDGADGLMMDLFYDGYTKTKLVCGIHSEVDNVVQGIKDMKEKIDELKKQLSAKKGKKLSQADKDLLNVILDDVVLTRPGSEEHIKLLHRLLK